LLRALVERTSSLCLPVSMPAQTMLCLAIFVVPSL
jgi:hypothetical protein